MNNLQFAPGIEITAEMALNRAASVHGEDERFCEEENVGLRETLSSIVTMAPSRRNAQGTQVRLCGPLLPKESILDPNKTYAIVFPDTTAVGGSGFTKQSLMEEGFRSFADTLRMAVLRFDNDGLPGILKNIRYPASNNERMIVIESLIRVVKSEVTAHPNAARIFQAFLRAPS